MRNTTCHAHSLRLLESPEKLWGGPPGPPTGRRKLQVRTESTPQISWAIPASEVNARGRLCSSLYVIRQAERRFIGLRTILESALVSHKANLRNRAKPPWGGAQASYFRWKFTRIKLPPMRNSVPSCNIAARRWTPMIVFCRHFEHCTGTSNGRRICQSFSKCPVPQGMDAVCIV